MDSSNIMLTDVGRLGRRRTRRENSNTTTENVTIHMDRRDRGHNKDNPLENRLSRSDNQSDCKDSATDSDDENDDMNTAIREFRRQQHQKICQQLEQQQPTSLDRSSSQRRPMRHPPNRYIKKCKSATFALDGMLYTIREYCFMWVWMFIYVFKLILCSPLHDLQCHLLLTWSALLRLYCLLCIYICKWIDFSFFLCQLCLLSDIQTNIHLARHL